MVSFLGESMEAQLQPESRTDPIPAADAAELEQTGWRRRFSSSATEEDFQRWQRRARLPYLKLSAASVFAFSGAGLVEVWFGTPAQFRSIAFEVISLLWPLAALWLGVASHPRFERWNTLIAQFVNATSALLVLRWYYQTIFVPDVIYAWMIIVAMFPLFIWRFSPVRALITIGPYFLRNEMLLNAAVGEHHVSSARVAWYAFVMVGIMMNALAERTVRTGYKQERVIEKQQLALDVERARTALLEKMASEQETLALSQEVRRQVAERSRDLADSLLRVPDQPPRRLHFAAGDIVDQRYRIVRLLGEGGMGQVHEVERIGDAHHFALKVLTRAAHRNALVRFAREAQIAAQLDHPNVVPALDIGVAQDGTPFLVMQLVAGSTLAQARDRFGEPRWAIAILLQIARALTAMHAQKIVHRDLKPSNVLLDGDIVKVSDFGISSFAESIESYSLTATGAIIGTPSYLAPEVVGSGHSAVAAMDMFSFGVVAYELFTKRLPHASPPVLDRMERRQSPSVVPIAALVPSLSADLARLIDRCLQLEPQARPTAASAQAVLAAAVDHTVALASAEEKKTMR